MPVISCRKRLTNTTSGQRACMDPRACFPFERDHSVASPWVPPITAVRYWRGASSLSTIPTLTLTEFLQPTSSPKKGALFLRKSSIAMIIVNFLLYLVKFIHRGNANFYLSRRMKSGLGGPFPAAKYAVKGMRDFSDPRMMLMRSRFSRFNNITSLVFLRHVLRGNLAR